MEVSINLDENVCGMIHNTDDEFLNQWRLKQTIKKLDNLKGNGTSMITLIITPKDQLSKINKLLIEENGTATNIRSRVTRLSVLSAITSVQSKLKLYNKIPTNGLIIYCGIATDENGKEKKICLDFEPYKPINISMYLCDNKFHTDVLKILLKTDDIFGFLVMDGNGALFGKLSGDNKEVLYRFTVDLPKKHGRGGQSALRFARLRLEKRHNYIKKCSEILTQLFITDDQINVSGLIFAGLADLKNELALSDFLDQRLKSKILKIVDVSYGGDNGFNQAIDLSSDVLANVKLYQEKLTLTKFFDEIAMDTGKFCYGVIDTINALESGLIDKIILWENLEYQRVSLIDENNINVIKFLLPSIEQNFKKIDQVPLIDWVFDNYKKFGSSLEIVTDKTPEGSQFCRGFGGIGAFLRYKCDVTLNQEQDDENENNNSKTEEDLYF